MRLPLDGTEKEIQKGAKPGSAKVKDADGNGYIDSNDKVIIGSKNPSFLMSMSNTLTYKNFYLSFLLNGTFKVTRELNEANIGSWSYNLYNYLHNADYWTPEHTNSKYASPAYNNFDGPAKKIRIGISMPVYFCTVKFSFFILIFPHGMQNCFSIVFFSIPPQVQKVHRNT